MSTLQQVELGVLGPLQVRQYGLPVSIPGAKPRAILTMLGLHGGSIVPAETLVELLWGDDPPRTAAKALPTHISTLRRTLGDGFVLTAGTGWALGAADVDATRYTSAAKLGREALSSGDPSQAVTRFDEALGLWRDTPELPAGPRGQSERTRWSEGHAALVEDRADALLATGRAAEIIGELEAAISEAPLRERRWGQLMLALYRAGRQGEALGAYQRARSLLVEELGVDPGPDLRRLEAAIVAQDAELEVVVPQQLQTATRTVTFLLTDIEGSTAAWELDADAMAVALARHDELVEQVVTTRGGRLVKTRGEGDATFSVFDRASGAATSAIELQEAIRHEPWALHAPMRIRVALHTGEVELRDGDYFGRAVNRAARLRSLATGGQILCSGATAELVIDSLPDDVVLADLGMRQLKNLARPEHVFELRLETATDTFAADIDISIERPELPAVLAGTGPFVGRGRELEGLVSAWQTALETGTHAVLIAGEPGVGKTRLAGEWARQAHELGAVVVYGRCDEDLGAPYQPFSEALRSLVPCLGSGRLRGLRGVKALLPLIPGLADDLPDLVAPAHADADSERYALFDAVAALWNGVCASAPVVMILDDLHWAAKPTLLLLRHLLRFGEHAPVQIVGTYRSTDLDRAHPLAAMLADLHRDGSADRLALSGLDEDDITAYVTKVGYDDEELARALASVTGGNPFFLIEALRHVDESGGRWDPRTLPQGVREAVSRRLSRLREETNTALAAAAVVGSRFSLDLVERVTGDDLIDAFDEAAKAGIVIEEPGGRYRFNHALVRQSLLAELASVRRMRLHQRIAATLEAQPGSDEETLAELAYHYFECAWAGNAAKAVEYCRRAADQAMARLAYEGAADLYGKALHALDELDEELPDRDDEQAELLIARCEALLAAGEVVSAARAVSQLQAATRDSARLAAWGTCFDGQLAMLTDPERLDDIEAAVSAAAEKLAELDDAAGEAKAHTVRAACLARLGRIGDAETALDQALTAARRAREHRRVNNVLANAPLAALWGPNPVPRAGGRCLDVVRLLRITTGSPVVEATSTRCQGVLDAFRGRAAAGRRLIDSARRTLTELGMRHALLEVEQFAGIVELVADDPAAAEPHLRRACDGFRRMGLDADTAETAALLARAYLALDRVDEADQLCTESERLAGHALKASIASRAVRAQLLARNGDHGAAKGMAEQAVSIAAGTDLLVDHGDACLALATVLSATGDVGGARAAAEQAVALYEAKGAAALVEKARKLLGERQLPTAVAPPEDLAVELENACIRTIRRLDAALEREAWDELERLFAPESSVENRRNVVGFPPVVFSSSEWAQEVRSIREKGARHCYVVVAVRGERLALTRLILGTTDLSPGAPHEEILEILGLDREGRIALQVFFEVDDMESAVAELEALYAQFEADCARKPLQNAASRAEERLNVLFADRRWDEVAVLLVDELQVEERRRGLRRESGHGATRMLDEVRVIAEIGVKTITSDPVAIRGEHLALSRVRFAGRDVRPDAYRTDVLRLTEIGDDGRVVSFMTWDIDDLHPAIAELDAKYLAGEAAPNAERWLTVLDALGELNRHEFGPVLTGLTFHNHQRTSFASEDYGRAVQDLWTLVPDAHYHVPVVYELEAQGALFRVVVSGRDTAGAEVQWAGNTAWDFEQSRVDMYEAEHLDAALARFKELPAQRPRVENATSRAVERYLAHFATRDWDAMAGELAKNVVSEDHRRFVGAGTRRGSELQIADMRASAEVGAEKMTSAVIATRGERIALCRVRAYNRNFSSDEFGAEMLAAVELDTDDRIAAIVVFDGDDIDAAIAELDSRYLAGEGAPYAQVWSMVARTYASLNRHELPATTGDWVNIDHRRIPAIESGEMTANVRASWETFVDVNWHVEAVHRLSDRGAVLTQAGGATSQQGFEAEARDIALLTFQENLIERCEIFDNADLDTALASFDEISRPVHRPENAASRVAELVPSHFAARDWDAIADLFAFDYHCDDRRRVVNAGHRHGRDAAVEDFRTYAEVGLTTIWPDVIATRGERLCLQRFQGSGRDPESAHVDPLQVVEINVEGRFVAAVVFEHDDFDAAFAELDARYVAREAASNAETWNVIVRGFGAMDRGERPSATPDWQIVDRRRLFQAESSDLTEYLTAARSVAPTSTNRIEASHRLNSHGAVVTYVASTTTNEGFDAEWRLIDVVMVEGDLINHVELFDESDLDTALRMFDELSQPTHMLGNDASRTVKRYLAHFTDRDWDAMAEMVTAGVVTEDRRRIVGAGIRRGRELHIADMRAAASVGGERTTAEVIATRGERLVLSRIRTYTSAVSAAGFAAEMLSLVEIDAEGRIALMLTFDAYDLDTAFKELDARYLAGEATRYAEVWSIVAKIYGALNRRQLPATTPDWVNVDHRHGIGFAPGDLAAYTHASWELSPDLAVYIEAVHRIAGFGAVVTHSAHGTTPDGFAAEWRGVNVLTVDGELINHWEVFEESDIEAALSRFDELGRRAPRLENAASQTFTRINGYLLTRDWDAMAEMIADDARHDDRRRVVNVGVLRGRNAQLANLRAIVEVGAITHNHSVTIAVRGDRLALNRTRVSGTSEQAVAWSLEVLAVVEVDTDHRITAGVLFDLEDMDGAVAELDACYTAGEGAAYAHTWASVTSALDAFNRGELPARTANFVFVDHRQFAIIEAGALDGYAHAAWDQTPNLTVRVESVLLLNDAGSVFAISAHGSSQEGFDAEWRMIELLMVEGDLVTRIELFDDADIDTALARFDELSCPGRGLQNAASRIEARAEALFAARDWGAMAEIQAGDYFSDDRRPIVGAGIRHGPDAAIADVRALADIGAMRMASTVIATRGERLALNRNSFSGDDARSEAFQTQVLTVIEINADNRMAARIAFDAEDFNAAFAELDARYLAGEAADYARTWSVISAAIATLNRRELPGTTPDWVNLDHRRAVAFEPGDMTANIRAAWEQTVDHYIYVEAVHRLNNFGALITRTANATSREGFDAEWRVVELVTVQGHLISRLEIFDEGDLEVALARLDELSAVP